MSQTTKNADESDSRKELLDAFTVFDKDGSGTISPSELRQVLAARGQKYTTVEIDEMIRHVDLDGDGLIDCRPTPWFEGLHVVLTAGLDNEFLLLMGH